MTPTPISVNQAAKATPSQYVVSGGVELALESAYAQFDGAASAAAWYPALGIYSPSGVLLARTFPSSSIAAGGAADVTFVPLGLAAAASAAAASQPAGRFFCSTPFNTAVGANIVTFDGADTNDSTKVYLDGTNAQRCRVTDTGVYIVTLDVALNGTPQAITGFTRALPVGYDNNNVQYGNDATYRYNAEVPATLASFPLRSLGGHATHEFASASRAPFYFRCNITAADVFQINTVYMGVTRVADNYV